MKYYNQENIKNALVLLCITFMICFLLLFLSNVMDFLAFKIFWSMIYRFIVDRFW